MGFLLSYKRLDNLCKDCFSSEKGVSEYIDIMERCYNNSYKGREWNDTYYTLKKYRYLRNKIAHDDYVEESTVCSYEDTIWLDNFYKKVLNSTDALSLYHDKLMHQQNLHVKSNNKLVIINNDEENSEKKGLFSFIKSLFRKNK